MALRMVSGFCLVIASWTIALVILSALGRWIAALLSPGAAESLILRAGLWWGLIVATALALMLSLLVPLRSGTVAISFLAASLVLGVIGLVLRRPNVTLASGRPRPQASVLLFTVSLGLAIGYLAFKALGPVTNYDSGLYHLGAIKYSGDFAAVPGLANLYFPLGYGNAQFALGALLGNGPWDGVGYRLLNGLLAAAVVCDVVVRLYSRRFSWGTFVLAVGTGAALIPLVGLSDFLVTSPTADTAILLLTLVSSAYLADFLSRRSERTLNASVVVATIGVMVAMRPTMLFFGVTALAVVAMSLWRQRTWSGVSRRGWIVMAVSAIALASVVGLRDRVLSGWLLYPLSLFSFDVPWRAEDPTAPREATLAAARNPFDRDQYSVAHSWDWIGPWLARLGTQWETYFVVLALLAATAAWLVARQRTGFPHHPSRLAAAVLPSAVAVLAWFTLSPPSFRFIWGPLFCLAFIPLGAALEALNSAQRQSKGCLGKAAALVLAALALGLLVVTAYSAAVRNQANTITQHREWTAGPLAVPYALAPVLLPPVTAYLTDSGLELVTPEAGSDQCWDNYPLCTPSPRADLALRGVRLQEGFVRQ